jgi:hypothetical protein
MPFEKDGYLGRVATGRAGAVDGQNSSGGIAFRWRRMVDEWRAGGNDALGGLSRSDILPRIMRDQLRQTFLPPESVPFWQLPVIVAQSELAGLDATRYRLRHPKLVARPVMFLALFGRSASMIDHSKSHRA